MTLRRTALSAALLPTLLAAPTWALDAKVVRDIERASSRGKLADLAEDLATDAAAAQPADDAEATRVASETSAYLLYIIAKQNDLLLKLEEAEAESE